ncbi:TatD family hydrolase [Natrialbaceae archaeon A-gly3]
MHDFETPVLDNHIHIDPDNGRGMEAVKDFARAGGTHLIVINKPSWHLGVEAEAGEDFRPVFERTLEVVAEASDILEGQAWAMLGVHPGCISQLIGGRGYNPQEAGEIMQEGIDVAAEYVDHDAVLGLKSGRPHWDAPDDVWEASNAVMRRAFEHGAELGCPVQLHAEDTEEMLEVAEWAEAAGMPREKVVKHFARGRLEGPTPSVTSREAELEVAAERGEPFLMETDFIDDPDRPGAVLGPKTVPKRVGWLLEEGYEEAVRTAHVETPREVYGIDLEADLE